MACDILVPENGLWGSMIDYSNSALTTSEVINQIGLSDANIKHDSLL
jgi:hypothetical protein